jgi:hypothetical protein
MANRRRGEVDHCRVDCRAQVGISGGDSAARQSGGGFRCRARWRSTGTSLPFKSGPSTVAFDVHFEDRCVVNEAIYRGQGHCRIRENLIPIAERLVGGDQHRPPFVAGADELEQHARLRLIFADVGEIIEDQQVEAIKTIDRSFECEFAPRNLQFLYEICGAGEEDAPPVLHKSKPDSRCQVRSA